MKSRFIAVLLALFLSLTACSEVPVSVKEADKEAQRLTTSFVANNTLLMKRVVDFYKAREYRHIDLAALKAAADGDKPEDVAKAVAAARKAVDAQYVKMLTKFLEIQKDLKQAVILRAEISKYLDSKVSYKELTDVILNLAEHVAEKKAGQ
jgi:hypothetical protein